MSDERRSVTDRIYDAARTPVPLVITAGPDTTVADIQARARRHPYCLLAVEDPAGDWTIIRWEPAAG